MHFKAYCIRMSVMKEIYLLIGFILDLARMKDPYLESITSFIDWIHIRIIKSAKSCLPTYNLETTDTYFFFF